MGLLDPIPAPYEPLGWLRKPLDERGRMVCEAWAMQGYGTPPGVFVFYLLKLCLYVGAWIFFCSRSPSLGGVATLGTWALQPLAFQKAIVWSLLFEVLGLGCGSGPLSGRYLPPVGGFLYFLRPRTTKLPLFPGLPLIGAPTRSLLDVGLYLALLVVAVRALLAPELHGAHLAPIVALVAALGVLDKTLFLAARAEHYWVTLLCVVATPHWIAGAKAVQLALWFWAGFSKLNHHFPTVVCVMTSNGPFTRFPWLRRRMYRDYPRDLRPSTLATALAHAGTAMELGVPVAFLLTPLGTPPVVAVLMMFALHGYITSHVPMGVPIEWNFMVVYGGLALFWAHPEVSLLSLGATPIAALLAVTLVALPIAGNLWPGRVSFLLAMRYYAGNWAWSVWLFRGESYRKLARLTTSSGWVYDQLARFYDRPTAVGLVGKVMGFRMMHLHGRALPLLVPKAVDALEDYEWLDGEIVAGLALGWNFGEGHLHQEQLLAAIQAQCGFEEGELRCVFVESQPMGGTTLSYRVVDAASGQRAAGELPVEELRSRQPWETCAPTP
ncbi:MAG: putative rane protein [Myxococcaceae bacterium]|nr:putative rane protein [Myxococcaceae bacterium]